MSAWQVIEKKYKQADLALNESNPRKAERLLRELVRCEPDEPLFHWRLGYALSVLRKYQEAIVEYRQALELDPKNVAALGCLGQAHMELGEWEPAEKAIRARLALKASPQHYVFLANILMETGRYDSAIECCQQAIELDPSFAEAFLNLGLAYRHKKQFKSGIEAFKKAVELDDRCSVAFRELGLIYYATNAVDLAKEALATCLVLNPDDAWADLYMALCLQNVGDFSKAARHFAAALKKDPHNPFFEQKYQEFAQQRAESKAKNRGPQNTRQARVDSAHRRK